MPETLEPTDAPQAPSAELFAQRLWREDARALRWGAALGIVVGPLGWLTDLSLLRSRPAELAAMTAARSAGSLACVLVWARTRGEYRSERSVERLSALFAVGGGGSLALLPWLKPTTATLQAGILTVALTAVCLLVPARSKSKLSVSLLLAGAWCAGAWARFGGGGYGAFHEVLSACVIVCAVPFLFAGATQRWHETRLQAFRASEALREALSQTQRTVASLEVAHREAAEARVVAESALRARSEFLARMSHELRTPMAGVLGAAEVLEGTELSEAARDHLRLLREAAEHQLELLNELLDFARVDSGRLMLESAPLDLRHLCARLVAAFTPVARARSLELRQQLTPGPLFVLGDATRLRQVVYNLLSNALKFTLEGHVLLRLEARESGGLQHVELALEDTGIGIEPARLEQLFEPFLQADASTTRRFGGTGLGLTLSRRLVETMGGTLEARSTLGSGATFTVRLTLPVAHEPRAEPPPPATAATLPPLRILLAEDTPVVAHVLQAVLERHGHQVTVVGDGAAAVEAARAEPFDAVLLDMQMPVLDGEQAAPLLRALPRGERIPLLALTADGLAEHRPRYLAAGVDEVLVKPVNWVLLSASLARCLAARSTAAPSSPA